MEHNAAPTACDDDLLPVPHVNWPANLFNDIIVSVLESSEATEDATSAQLWQAVSQTWTGDTRGRKASRAHLRLVHG